MCRDNPITRAIELAGLQQISRVCGVTYQAVRKWEKAGRLPRTEWTGETNYADSILSLQVVSKEMTKADFGLRACGSESQVAA